MKPKLVLIRGLPGSGKSTKAKAMVGFTHLENDQWLYNEKGEYEWTEERRRYAACRCIASTYDHLKEGHDVVVSNCFITKKSMKPYLKMAKDFLADVEIVVAEDNFGNIHNVSEETLKKMKEDFEE